MLPRARNAAVFVLLTVSCAHAQFAQGFPSATERISADEAIHRAFNDNVLTFKGKPFHAVLDITEEKADPAYAGHVELFWINQQRYRLVLTSRDFDQTLVINGPLVQEIDRGDFYPNWLHGFVLALTDPMPRHADFSNQTGMIGVGPRMHSCLRRDDRPGGITDQLTWGEICFADEGPHLDFVIDFTYNMEFHDFQGFAHKQIARTYISGEGDHARLHGTLSTLEELKNANESLFVVSHPTAPSDRLLTTFVSTAQEESMVESKPTEVNWPTVREGKLDGYMIVHAITDRTGQVRETSKHNSDNGELESYGRLVALKYKFKPLIVEGAPQQMEMPLVLHFTTVLGAPIPELSESDSRKLISGCDLSQKISARSYGGQPITIALNIDGTGHFNSIRNVSPQLPIFPIFQFFSQCTYGIYKQDGKPAPYRAQITMTAK